MPRLPLGPLRPLLLRRAPRASQRRPITIHAPGPSTDHPDYSEQTIITQAPSDSSDHPHYQATPGLVASTSLPAPPESPRFTPRHLQHPFDTHAFVSYLEKNGLDRPTARDLMESVKDMIIKRGKETRATMVGKEEQENAAYLFNAALSELRTELSVQTRNDGLALKAVAGAIRRDVEGLEQKIKEDIQTLKHDIEMDMNNRKAETRTEMKGFDIYIEEINNKFTISLGDLRTEIESVKWDATRRAISVIILIVVATIGSVTYFTVEPPPAKAKLAAPAKPAPVMKDMGVGTYEEFIDDVPTYTEERLDKLLQEQGLEMDKLKKEKKEAKKRSKEGVYVDRI
ncbi:hypothetical protein L202_04163 [Cryptococcus amylolentus CBS 6039]|uniref:Mitochondrial protein n=1 Tax=Cryptococcus amylolentus CBS 6039 TaxID=1295533 RepID=A0A1E3HQD7_9TREE|nr:hypothetical protein L202_04163 [Cryptococcus amylolentus CBS 6039]ODN78547.1 hypothetical protein L202_04163 [Cryptococcus amylolentus CBS 6039]